MLQDFQVLSQTPTYNQVRMSSFQSRMSNLQSRISNSQSRISNFDQESLIPKDLSQEYLTTANEK